MPNGPVEPAAEWRQYAAILHGIYLALVQEGFTEQQALTLIGQALIANALGGK